MHRGGWIAKFVSAGKRVACIRPAGTPAKHPAGPEMHNLSMSTAGSSQQSKRRTTHTPSTLHVVHGAIRALEGGHGVSGMCGVGKLGFRAGRRTQRPRLSNVALLFISPAAAKGARSRLLPNSLTTTICMHASVHILKTTLHP